MKSRDDLWFQTFVPRFGICRRRSLLSFEVHPQPRCGDVHGEDTRSHVGKHQLIHDRLSWFQEFLGKCLQELGLVDRFPFHVKTGPAGEF